MQIQDENKATGALTIEVFDEHGQLKERLDITNLVVTVGKNFIASRMVGTTPAVMSHMAVGSGAVAPADANTTLGGELGRAALTSSSAANNVVTYAATFAAGVGTGAVTEAGIFNAAGAGAGTLLCRTTFAVINKGASDSMTITWTVTIN